MSLKRVIVLSGVVLLAAVALQIVFAEEATVIPADSTVIDSSQQPDLQNDLQWAWGEVTNLDSQAKTVTLQYLNYETDQENELVLVVDENTTFENIKDLNELKLKDTLSVDYTIGVDNKNMAKNISFEKPEVSSSTPAAENSEPVTPPSITGQPIVEATPPVQPEIPVEPSIAVNAVPAQESAPAPTPVEPEPAPVVGDQAQ